jgi:Na+-transporting NADH:ubiquinone oxidoreductase subunit NqrF
LSAKIASLTKNRYELESEDGKFKYHVALIDYMQEWNLNKKLERFAKISFRNADP